MATHPLAQLAVLGQSPWHDNIRRSLLTSGALRKMVQAGDITGLTSNPTIFEQAIAGSPDYDDQIAKLARGGKAAIDIYDAMSIDDIRAAADVFAPVYRRTNGNDGYVSIEVAPLLARDTAATVREARRLWKAVDKPNLMVKIPATREGLPAITQCLADGINVNVTLIFSIERYRDVMEAFLAGLEKRVAGRKPIDNLASVASFFVSRVDTLVDKLLDLKKAAVSKSEGKAFEALKGKAAIANATLAYAAFRSTFQGPRWEKLATRGARLQRPLWASTSTKNPAYPDVYYVEALIAPDTVDTMPPATITAYKDHGQPALRLTADTAQAEALIEKLEEFGIHMDDVTTQLEREGVASFTKSFESLLAGVEQRRQTVLLADRQVTELGRSAATVSRSVAAMTRAEFGPRLWRKDSTLWKPNDPAHQDEIKIRMGWLDLPEQMLAHVAQLTTFAGEVRRAGFTHALLLGMGGSSLAPEVLRVTFGVAKGYLDLAVLDSTDPAAVLAAEARGDLARTLFIVSSKSGGTAEINAFSSYFWSKLTELKGRRAGENFIAITDPGTALEALAKERNFRRIFVNPPEIGGRYSALSLFGLVPAALMGIDVAKLLGRAQRMSAACGASVPPARNPGLQLGAILGALTKSKRDKVTIVTSPKVRTFGYWVEQLIAESTGKDGTGILPVEGEALTRARGYGLDRLFVHLKLGPDAANERALKLLTRAGQPLVTILLEDVYDLGAEFMRWEIATAAASWVLAIDPFDQPNVQEAKDKTKALLATLAETGQLPAASEVRVSDKGFADELRRHLKTVKRNDYVAVMAYLHATPKREKLLRELQSTLRDKTGAATTIGYGPRFLHSTGQLHKGGNNSGVFIQFVCDDDVDAPVPGQPYSFSGLKNAQSLGDLQALLARKRRVLRINLGTNVERNLRAVLDVLN